MEIGKFDSIVVKRKNVESLLRHAFYAINLKFELNQQDECYTIFSDNIEEIASRPFFLERGGLS